MACGKKIDDNTIVLFTWNDYMNPQVIQDFTKETGIKVKVEFFSNNEDMLAKMKRNPSYYDIITPSDYIVDHLVKKNMLAPLDFSKIPNSKYLIEPLKNPVYDTKGEYSLPYAWGTVGIIYDKTKVTSPIDSWNALWNSEYSGSIIMSDSIRETIGISLKSLGYSIQTRDPKILQEAKELLKKQVPLVMGYIGDETEDLMGHGEATLAVLWSGDAVNSMRKNPNMDYVIPKEGTILWTDCFIIPRSSHKKSLSEAFINYMYKPESGYRNWEFIGYSTPNKETWNLLPENVRIDPRWYPAIDRKDSFFEVNLDLDPEILAIYNEIWMEIKS